MLIKIVQKNDFLEFIVTGRFELENALSKFHLVIDVCNLTDVRKVLIDYRKLHEVADGIERTFYAFGIENRYKSHIREGGEKIKFAFVGDNIDVEDPGGQLAELTNFPGKIFDNYNSAVKWINENGT